jgi:LysM repeat protein
MVGFGCNSPPPTVVVQPATATTVATTTPLPSPTAQPTSTPTLAATPQVYVVQAGDTILTIAAKFNRSKTSLQLANGLLDPRQLMVGQRLIIPPPTLDESLPTVTPTPLPMLMEAAHLYPNPSGSVWCLVEVHNSSEQAVTEVQVEATLLDSNGVVLDRARAFSQLEVILPKMTSPAAILFNNPPADFAQYQLKVITARPLPAQNRYYFELEVSALQGEVVGVALYRLSGQLHNQGKFNAESIRLVAVAYNATNQILAQRQANLAVELLKADATTPFMVDLMTHERVDHYHVFVESLQAK